MTVYKTARGKTVALGAFTLTVRDDDGRLLISFEPLGEKPSSLELTEGEASQFYDLLGDVMSWESHTGTTENAIAREAHDDE